jgi:hypothetical protein
MHCCAAQHPTLAPTPNPVALLTLLGSQLELPLLRLHLHPVQRVLRQLQPALGLVGHNHDALTLFLLEPADLQA